MITWYLILFGMGFFPVLIETQSKKLCEQIKVDLNRHGHKTLGCENTKPNDIRNPGNWGVK